MICGFCGLLVIALFPLGEIAKDCLKIAGTNDVESATFQTRAFYKESCVKLF